MTDALTSSTDQSGCAWRTSAVMPAVCGAAIDVPESTVRPLPLPRKAEVIVSPGAATSGLSAGPRVPREVNELGGSTIFLSYVWIDARPVPYRRTCSVPAVSDARGGAVAEPVNWNIGIAALPAIPALKCSKVDDRSTPLAPAAWALFARTAEPHARVESLSSHSSQTNLPAAFALSAAEYAAQPALFAPARATTGAVRFSVS